MYGANVIIFEGILSFTTQKIRDLMDLKIFVDEDADVRLARRFLCSSTVLIVQTAKRYPRAWAGLDRSHGSVSIC